jgi:ribonuclease HI
MKVDISLAELKKAIRQLKKKSPGPDGITNEMIQHLGNASLRKLLDIFNLSWTNGEVPQCWKEARMTPILKKGKNKTKVLSYRPISLTSCICKTMERIVNQRLQWYLESENIIVSEQAGFRRYRSTEDQTTHLARYRSTEDQTTHLAQVIEDTFQAKKVMLAAFIDLQKAFDKVWKDGLLVKLRRTGIGGNMFRWTKSYLHNRRARVLVDGQSGQNVLLRQGVPQGGVLSPTLFILFINDIVAELPNGIQAALYADDLVLWCTEEYTTTATYRMQLALDRITAWANRWCITINKEKSSAMLFSLSTKTKVGNLTLGGTPLEYEDQQTYLGVTYDRRLTWKEHIQNAEAKARRKLNIMRKLAGTKWGANERILKTIYLGAVRPHLEYGSSSWMTAAKSHQQNLDRVQNQALRIITGGMRSTPIEKMEQTAGIPPLSKGRECKALIQAAKFKSFNNHPMKIRQAQLSSGRLKRSSFVKETKALQRKHQEMLPAQIEDPNHTLDPPPWENKLESIAIRTTVPHLTTKDEHSDVSKKALTLAMLEEMYPQETWIRIYTDGSAKDAIRSGGAGLHIQYPNGQHESAAIPTGKHCTNYRAEVEALVHAANTISRTADPIAQIVFLSDARSVLEAITKGKLPQLEEALQTIKCFRIALQWIPSHCGVQGNEEADKMAKVGAEENQTENMVTHTEMKTIIKSLYRTPQSEDAYHHLSRPEQVTIFRLRTGHNRLNQHMYRRFHLTTSPACPCGEAEQTTEHILQCCSTYQLLREEIWPLSTSFLEKLYGPVEELQKTTDFILRTALQV